MMTRLQALNLNSVHIHPVMKGQMFKTYIRPVLTSGTKNMELNGREILEMKKMEGNALKHLLRIPTRCHTTDIVDALNIEQTNRYLNRIMKLKFLIRLTNNDLTREILNISIDTNYENSFVSEIARYLNLSHDYNLESMVEYAKTQIKNLKAVKKPTDEMINKNKVFEIRKACDCKDRLSIPDKLFRLTKFKTNGPQLSLNEIRSRSKNRKTVKKANKKYQTIE